MILSFCKSLCKSTSVFILSVVNIVFLLLGFALILAPASIFVSKFGVFFYSDFLIVILTSGITIMLVALLGLKGACSQKKRYLCPYSVALVVCLVLQIAGLSLLVRFNRGIVDAQAVNFNQEQYNKLSDSVMAWLKTNTEHIYDQAQCSINADTITCTADSSSWFETFVNTECMLQDGATCDGSGADVTFCRCQDALTNKLQDLSVPLEITAACVVGGQALLLLAVLMLCCIGRRQQKQGALDLEAPLSRDLRYAEVVSVGPEIRTNGKKGADLAVVASTSQAISMV